MCYHGYYFFFVINLVDVGIPGKASEICKPKYFAGLVDFKML